MRTSLILVVCLFHCISTLAISDHSISRLIGVANSMVCIIFHLVYGILHVNDHMQQKNPDRVTHILAAGFLIIILCNILKY